MTRLGVGSFRDAGFCAFGPCCAYCEGASKQRGLRGTFRPWPTLMTELPNQRVAKSEKFPRLDTTVLMLTTGILTSNLQNNEKIENFGWYFDIKFLGCWKFAHGASGSKNRKKKFWKISRLRKMANFDISGTYASNFLKNCQET